ncbi:MAG: glutamate racemase [Woeseia sp.]
MTEVQQSRPIGIFDSGVGGLTVLKSIRDRLPGEHLLYLGDTARLPYGTKSPASVLRYASQAAAHLARRDIKLLVVACNTASAVAIDELTEALRPLPVVGVVGPGARAAVQTAPAGRHLVLATEATVRLGAYRRAIAAIDPDAEVRELACELLVALAEEGWTRGDITDAVVRRYLAMLDDDAVRFEPQSVILGCTHFPLLRDALQNAIGPGIPIVDSAGTTADVVAALLSERDLLVPAGSDGTMRLLATDGARRFARVGRTFLGQPLSVDDIEITDL